MLGQEGRTELLSGAPAQKRAHKGRPGQLPGLWRGQGTAPRMSRAPGKPWATSPWAQLPLTLQWHCPLVLLQSGSKPLFTSQLQGPQVGVPHQPFGHCWSILGREIPLLLQPPNHQIPQAFSCHQPSCSAALRSRVALRGPWSNSWDERGLEAKVLLCALCLTCARNTAQKSSLRTRTRSPGGSPACGDTPICSCRG